MRKASIQSFSTLSVYLRLLVHHMLMANGKTDDASSLAVLACRFAIKEGGYDCLDKPDAKRACMMLALRSQRLCHDVADREHVVPAQRL